MVASSDPPDFVIAGAAKCGTTWLYACLDTHPQVFMTEPKEPHYFASDLRSPYYITDREAYLKLFETAPSGSRRGEASVHYLSSSCAVDNICAHNADTKFIVLLRNPIDMAVSFHAQLFFNGEEDVEDFEMAWRLQEPRARSESMPRIFTDSRPGEDTAEPSRLQYRTVCALGTQVRDLSRRVPRDQRLILTLDDVRADPGAVLRTVMAFLEVDDIGLVPPDAVNVARQPRMHALNRVTAWGPLAHGPAARALKPLFHKVGFHPMRMIRKLNTTKKVGRPLNPDFRKALVSEFAPEITLLEETLDRTFAHWRQ